MAGACGATALASPQASPRPECYWDYEQKDLRHPHASPAARPAKRILKPHHLLPATALFLFSAISTYAQEITQDHATTPASPTSAPSIEGTQPAPVVAPTVSQAPPAVAPPGIEIAPSLAPTAVLDAAPSATHIEKPASDALSARALSSSETEQSERPALATLTTESILDCPHDALRAAYEQVLKAKTTTVIDLLTLDGEVLRVCEARQLQVKSILQLSSTVSEVAAGLLAQKATATAAAWGEAETALHAAKLTADLEHQRELAKLRAAAAPERPASSLHASAQNGAPMSANTGSDTRAAAISAKPALNCIGTYRITAIMGAGGVTSARLMGLDGTSETVTAGDRLSCGADVLAVGQGLVTLKEGETREVLAISDTLESPAVALTDEGFLVTPLGGPASAPSIPAFVETTSNTGDEP